MATGLGLLGIPAREFWTMTPREFEAAVRGRFGIAGADVALSRSELGALMHRFPDATS